MSNISDLLDRIHAINQTINATQLTAYRYFPGSNGKIPFIVPMLSAATYEPDGTLTAGDGALVRVNRQITLLCAVGSPLSDVPIQTAHKNTENIIDPVLTTYYNNPGLRNSSGTRFALIIDDAIIESDTGIVLNTQTGLFEVRFTLTVPMSINY